MVDIQTAIDELNTGKIEFAFKDDDCCTTEGEVVILLKRLAELEKADVAEVVRCKNCTKRIGESIAGETFCLIHEISVPYDYYCASGERRDT